MKKTTALVMVGMLLLGACGDDDAAGALDTCEGIADATIALVQDVIDEFEALSPSEASDVMSGQMTPAFEAIAARGTEIGTAAETLACADLDAMVAERADQLVADPANGFTQLIKQGTMDGEDVLSRLFR
ncbi:MAG: hypothetical protein HZA58_04505 [Acidimicrobiia bacterium]|nr:hypothetical protein [Acidimicrobiia bacterium]